MVEVEFYRDKKGAACARGEDQRLATFLETDLQESVEVTSDLIALLSAGQEPGKFHGNGHCVTISPKTALIESSFDEDAPDRRIERKILLKAVRKWLKFIS